MELIKIVDENGNFTGQIMDKEEAHNKNLLHNEVATFIINDKKQILLQKRSANKRFDANKWALCAGHVGAYEDLKDAMVRELGEEVGLKILKEDLHELGERELTLKDTNSHIIYFFYVKCNKQASEFTVQKEELSEVKWFNINDVIDMINNNDNSITFTKKRLKYFELLLNLN